MGETKKKKAEDKNGRAAKKDAEFKALQKKLMKKIMKKHKDGMLAAKEKKASGEK